MSSSSAAAAASSASSSADSICDSICEQHDSICELEEESLRLLIVDRLQLRVDDGGVVLEGAGTEASACLGRREGGQPLQVGVRRVQSLTREYEQAVHSGEEGV